MCQGDALDRLSAALADNCGDEADDFAIKIDEGGAGIAVVSGGIGLEQVEQVDSSLREAWMAAGKDVELHLIFEGDEAAGDDGEWFAERDGVGITEAGDAEVGGVDAEYGEIGEG
jgi:hypothetical protein